ncbi:MAG TPA: hypothetical protein VG406_27855 [Isosphaeraceae bacterium]|nr:hypothetical protein [Isosphaeraceae bacterium]
MDTLLVGLWPAWREVALDLAALATDSRARSTFPAILRDLEDIAHDLRYWRRLWTWEAWSLARWWLLFGSLTIATTPLSRRERPGVEGAILLLRFSPWLIALEIGFMIGVWIARWNANIVPEPSTIFASGWGIRKYGFLFHVLPWLKRGGPSTFVVGIAFFRTVPGWRWVEAVLGSLVLVLIAIPLSIAWSMLWMP